MLPRPACRQANEDLAAAVETAVKQHSEAADQIEPRITDERPIDRAGRLNPNGSLARSVKLRAALGRRASADRIAQATGLLKLTGQPQPHR